jgi:hypothetical protein
VNNAFIVHATQRLLGKRPFSALSISRDLIGNDDWPLWSFLLVTVSSRFDEWRAERVCFLESRLQEIDALASAGKLSEAVTG